MCCSVLLEGMLALVKLLLGEISRALAWAKLLRENFKGACMGKTSPRKF